MGNCFHGSNPPPLLLLNISPASFSLLLLCGRRQDPPPPPSLLDNTRFLIYIQKNNGFPLVLPGHKNFTFIHAMRHTQIWNLLENVIQIRTIGTGGSRVGGGIGNKMVASSCTSAKALDTQEDSVKKILIKVPPAFAKING